MFDVVPVTIFAGVTVIVLVSILMPYWRRRDLHQTLRQAMDKGQSLDLDLIKTIMEQDHRPAGISKLTLQRWSVMIVALGIARGGMVFIEQESTRQYGPALAVIILGAGLWVASLVTGPERNDGNKLG